MPTRISDFLYRSFDFEGEPRLTLKVTKKFLPLQTHLLPIISTIKRTFLTGGTHWRLHLTIEETEPFLIEFTKIRGQAAIARFTRNDLDALMVLVPDARGAVDVDVIKIIMAVLGLVASRRALMVVFDYLTGLPPPLAATLHISESANSGMDMLAMCVADTFLKTLRWDGPIRE